MQNKGAEMKFMKPNLTSYNSMVDATTTKYLGNLTQ